MSLSRSREIMISSFLVSASAMTGLSSVSSCFRRRSIDCLMVWKLVSMPPSQRFVDVEHPAALGFLADRVLRLLLGADEEDRAATGDELTDVAVGVA